MELIIIGTITKPQGIKGELKVIPFTEDVGRFNQLSKVYINGDIYTIQDVRINNQEVYIKLMGVDDRNSAELYRNQKIEIPKKELKEPKEGRYYIFDLIGCDVLVGGVSIGSLDEILQNGTIDVYVVKTPKGRIVMFPALRDLLLDINIQDKTISLDKDRFQEVVVYED